MPHPLQQTCNLVLQAADYRRTKDRSKKTSEVVLHMRSLLNNAGYCYKHHLSYSEYEEEIRSLFKAHIETE